MITGMINDVKEKWQQLSTTNRIATIGVVVTALVAVVPFLLPDKPKSAIADESVNSLTIVKQAPEPSPSGSEAASERSDGSHPSSVSPAALEQQNEAADSVVSETRHVSTPPIQASSEPPKAVPQQAALVDEKRRTFFTPMSSADPNAPLQVEVANYVYIRALSNQRVRVSLKIKGNGRAVKIFAATDPQDVNDRLVGWSLSTDTGKSCPISNQMNGITVHRENNFATEFGRMVTLGPSASIVVPIGASCRGDLTDEFMLNVRIYTLPVDATSTNQLRSYDFYSSPISAQMAE
ncbi:MULTISPECIES: hypothetical protein [Asticcacaulis]|uniref:hypothetical protein n=1 Tax=Asticcacaulis TaxID=76890 RepID=UPI001AE61B0B|nr:MULTISPECIES: hypothetical protein [Asticcacaulis]MBP2159555.1 hypothetical protein [Asticcacaulis solisilvae]MDR6800618.1 hypothetical protein [Asticcacaulis sp. BE141]